VRLAAEVLYTGSALKDLKRLDRPAARRIVNRIDTDLAAHPGNDKALTGQDKGLFSYRVARLSSSIFNARKRDSCAAHCPPRGSISAGLMIHPGAAGVATRKSSALTHTPKCVMLCVEAARGDESRDR